MINNALFSSETDRHDTPDDLIADLATVFDFDTDVCASRPNVCDHYYDKEEDGLKQNWLGMCWCNPPYGRDIIKWFEKGVDEDNFSNELSVVYLVPARTDTKWFHYALEYATHVVFIKGRLKFGNAGNPAPFPSCFIVFGNINHAQKEKLYSYGQGFAL